MLRRIRGLVGMALLWSVPWALAGVTLALVVRSRGGYQQRRLEAMLVVADWPSWAGGTAGYLAMRGGTVGVVNGLLLGAALLVAYRNRVPLRRLAGWQFAALGSLTTGAVATVLLGMPPIMAIVGAAVGAVSGAAYLGLAKRGAGPDDGRDRLTAGPSRPAAIGTR